jgi:hypothetical protein
VKEEESGTVVQKIQMVHVTVRKSLRMESHEHQGTEEEASVTDWEEAVRPRSREDYKHGLPSRGTEVEKGNWKIINELHSHRGSSGLTFRKAPPPYFRAALSSLPPPTSEPALCFPLPTAGIDIPKEVFRPTLPS